MKIKMGIVLNLSIIWILMVKTNGKALSILNTIIIKL